MAGYTWRGERRRLGTRRKRYRGVAEESGKSSIIPSHPPLCTVLAIVHPRSTFAISLSCCRPVDPGFASPVLFVIGGWMYREWRKDEVRDEGGEMQGAEGEIG
jgi:hypothetical protein